MHEPPLDKHALILIGANNDAQLAEIDFDSAEEVETATLGNGTAWIHTTNYPVTLSRIVAEGPAEATAALCEPDATTEEIVAAALRSKPVSHFITLDRTARSDLSFEVAFQPIINLQNKQIIGYEALLRAHSATAVLDGEQLVAKALHEGWISELDEMGRDLALKALGDWLGEGLLFLNILAPEGIFDLTAARKSVTRAQDIGLEPDQLVFETAERNQYTNMNLVSAQLNKLRDMGIRLAVDDLGEGYSSLFAAASFKPDVLKISGELVQQLPSDEAIATISAVVGLAHQTGAWVIAEKVETSRQEQVLTELEVDWAQGHKYGAAVSPDLIANQ